MNNKKECNIIRDLLPNYIEKLVSDDSKDFVEQHLVKCRECNEILNEMNSQIIIEDAKVQNDDKIELKKINKVRKKISIHTSVICFGSIIIGMFILILTLRSLHTYIFLKNVYLKYNQINQTSNYRLTVQTIYKNYKENSIPKEIVLLVFDTLEYQEIFDFIHKNYSEIDVKDVKEEKNKNYTEVVAEYLKENKVSLNMVKKEKNLLIDLIERLKNETNINHKEISKLLEIDKNRLTRMNRKILERGKKMIELETK